LFEKVGKGCDWLKKMGKVEKVGKGGWKRLEKVGKG
jgi:hypothetical protein